MRPGGSSDESDSDEDNFVEDKNALALIIREKNLFRLSLEVGPRIPPQVPHSTVQSIGWILCDWPTEEVNACTHRVRMDCTYRPNVPIGCQGTDDMTINPYCPTNPGPPPQVELEIQGDVPSLAWRFHWHRRHVRAPRGTPFTWPHCPVCPARTITGWQSTMDHMKTVNMRRYPMAGNRAHDETAVGNAVSDLHDDPVVLHHALRQAILVERDIFWHCFNRWKLAEVSLWTLQQACKRLRVTVDQDNLVKIVIEAEKMNRAAAAVFHSAGTINIR